MIGKVQRRIIPDQWKEGSKIFPRRNAIQFEIHIFQGKETEYSVTQDEREIVSSLEEVKMFSMLRIESEWQKVTKQKTGDVRRDF